MQDIETIFQSGKSFWTEKAKVEGAIFNPATLFENVTANSAAMTDLLRGYPQDKLKEATLLDFGCGVGRLIPFIAPKVGKYIGVDCSPTCLEQAKHTADKFQNVVLCELKHSDSLWDDVYQSTPNGVDFFISWNVFQHQPHSLFRFLLAVVAAGLPAHARANIQIDWPPVVWDHPRELRWRWDQVADDDFRCRWWPDWMIWSILEEVGFTVLEEPSGGRECWRLVKK